MKAMTRTIQMVDLKRQYEKVKKEMDSALLECVASTQFINGKAVKELEKNLAHYLDSSYVIPCANGTDALQIALMALDLEPGDEVIIPAFTYVATAEVVALLGLTPIMVDVDPQTFNVTAELIEPFLSSKTKAIIPVHLFGQVSDMESILEIAKKHQLKIVEDNAQAIGASYRFENDRSAKSGTIGDIGTTSFYPSKTLGCYGDGGAIFTQDEHLADRLRMIANHGQNKLYHHQIIGCNSRLDSVQASVLNVKLKYLDGYIAARRTAAQYYDEALKEVAFIERPFRHPKSDHTFHQYTVIIKEGHRDALKAHLKQKGIPSMIYYPLPLYKQEAYSSYFKSAANLPNTEALCKKVLSLPMHTELDNHTLAYIADTVIQFFKNL